MTGSRLLHAGWLVAESRPRGRVVIVCNVAWFFTSHRLPVGVAARDAGWDVHVCAAADETVPVIREAGLTFHDLDVGRSGIGLRDARALGRLRRLYRSLRPDLVHHVTIKPVLLGSLAARSADVPAVINAFSGLGTLFLSRGRAAALRRTLVLQGLAYATRGRRVFGLFQNLSDRDPIVRRGIIPAHRVVIIPGSGVDLDRFHVVPEPSGTPLVVLPARMLRDKGIIEFVQAARLIAASGRSARFALVGPLDPHNVTGLTAAEMQQLVSPPIEWWGERNDMPEVLGSATVVCLPSYGEGLPKALAEAAACGRAIVTTDVPGCRDAVEDGVSGILVPPRAPEALAAAIGRVLDDQGLRSQLGRGARQRAESLFDVRTITRQTLALYDHAVAGND